MEKKPLSPYVRLAMTDTIDHRIVISRSIWDYEIIYVEKGSIKVNVNNRNMIAKQGDIIFLKPKVHHELKMGEGVVQPHVHFDLFKDRLSERILVSLTTLDKMTPTELTYFRNDDLNLYNLNLPTIMHLYNHELIAKILDEIIDEFSLKKEYFNECMSSLMERLLVELIRGYSVSKLSPSLTKSRLNIDKLERFMLRHYEENPSLDDLANSMGVSKIRFIRIFKKHYGTTPHKYINNLRHERAIVYLIYFPRLNISDISKKLHFDSVQSFSKWFYKETGKYPKDFRNGN